jgi:hypothetical protein
MKAANTCCFVLSYPFEIIKWAKTNIRNINIKLKELFVYQGLKRASFSSASRRSRDLKTGEDKRHILAEVHTTFFVFA